MLLFASLFGMLAVGSVAFLNVDDGEDPAAPDADDTSEDTEIEPQQNSLSLDLLNDTPGPESVEGTAPAPSFFAAMFSQSAN